MHTKHSCTSNKYIYISKIHLKSTRKCIFLCRFSPRPLLNALILSLVLALWFLLQTEILPNPHSSNFISSIFWDSLSMGDSLWRICYHLVTKESITEYKAPLLTLVGNLFICIAFFSIIPWCVSLHNNPRLLKEWTILNTNPQTLLNLDMIILEFADFP